MSKTHWAPAAFGLAAIVAVTALAGCDATSSRPGSFADDRPGATRTERPFRPGNTRPPRPNATAPLDKECPALVTADDVNRATGLTLAPILGQTEMPETVAGIPQSVQLPFGRSSLCTFVDDAGNTVVVLTMPLPTEDAAEQVMDALVQSGQSEPTDGVGDEASYGAGGLFARDGGLIVNVQVIANELSESNRRSAAVELAEVVFSRI